MIYDTNKKTTRNLASMNTFGGPKTLYQLNSFNPYGPGGLKRKVTSIKPVMPKDGSQEISQPGDPAELEADRVAAEVTNGYETDLLPKKKEQSVIHLQRAEGKGSSTNISNDINNLSSGHPLGEAEKDFFEPRFGADFSDVRVHTDERAAGMAEGINARAFTKGNDIIFAKGEYQPGTGAGKSLIAHELAHVVQQGQNSATAVNRKEDSGKAESGILDNVFAAGTKGAAWVIEKTPTVNVVPVPGFEFMANFMKGMMVGSLERLGQEKVENLWRINRNVAKAVNSLEYMKAYFWGFLRGFFGDFILIYEIPGIIKSTVNFTQQLIANIRELSKEDLQGFAARIDDIKTHIVEGGTEYVNSILADIKAGKASELIIETLKSISGFSLDAGKSVGGQLTGVMLDFFSKDHKKLGKDLGSIIGELSGTIAFTALLAAITAGAGAVWGGVRTGIKTVTEIIGNGIGKAVKAIGTVFKRIGSVFEKLISGTRAFVKGFGRRTSKLFKGIKGKLDEVLEKVKGLIDDVLEKLSGSPDADYKVKGGSKNTGWNELLNQGLEPNKKYLVDSRYLYETDEFRRVQKVSGKLELKPRGRNTYQQGKTVEIKDGIIGEDEGGHLIAQIFNGPGEQINYVPQKAVLNKGSWKMMEKEWAEALKQGKKVNIEIKMIYDKTKRPETFRVLYEIDGEEIIKTFKNI